ncbi:MAG: DsbA family protein [Deltaproteobacteria bacterium]|nr:DsbA family protein [Deltaproteobacteria bacterium]
MNPVRLEVWSDYLCPWCRVADYRLNLLQREFGAALEIEFKSYLLRPRPAQGGRDAAKFARYTEGWRRPAAEPDAPRFCPWPQPAPGAANSHTESPPSHSIPAHLAAKAAARQGPAAFQALHAALLDAYFEKCRDISSAPALQLLWREAGLPEAELAAALAPDPQLLAQIHAEHQEAQALGITGVPALRAAGSAAVATGALPLAVYRRWIGRLQSARDDA